MSLNKKDYGRALEGRLTDGNSKATGMDYGRTTETPQKTPKRGRMGTSPTLNLSVNDPGIDKERATSTPKNVSVLSFLWNEDEGRSIKKPREGSISTPGAERRSSINHGKKMSEKIAVLIKSADKDLRETRRWVTENPNTKKEIKALIKSLSSTVSQLCTREILGCLEEQVGHKRDVIVIEETMDAQIQTDMSACQAGNGESMGKSKVELISVGTQTNPRKADKVQSLEYVKTFSEWEAIVDMQWDKELLTSLTIKDGGNLFETEGDVVKLCWVNRRENRSNERQKLWKDRYPELMNADGDFEVLEQTLKLRARGAISNQKIIKAVVDGAEEDVWTKLTRAKEELDGRSKLVMNEIPGVALQRVRKLVAWVFSEGNVEVEIFVSKERQSKESTAKTPNAPKPSRNTYAVVVEEKGLQFKEVLERVKPALKDTTLAKSIRGLRSTREGGKLVITMDKDVESVDKVKELLGSLHKDMDVRVLGDERKSLKQVHIKGMDALTCKEEVLSAIEGKVGSLTGRHFRFSDMRPNINNTRAITFWVEGLIAERLIGDGQIRVGMVNCRVEERINVVRCRRCWRYGHIAKGCTGPDLSKACYRCGQDGHDAKSCAGEEECPLCCEKGHRADTGRCKIFQRALVEARRRKQNSKPVNTNGDDDPSPARDHFMEEVKLPLDIDTGASQAPGPIGADAEDPNV